MEPALELYREALCLKEELLGPEHPDTALTAHNYAFCLGSWAGARKPRSLSGRAVAVFSALLRPEHPKRLAAEALAAALATA